MKSNTLLGVVLIGAGLVPATLVLAQLNITIPNIANGVAQQQKQQQIQELDQKISQLKNQNDSLLGIKIVGELDYTNTSSVDHFNTVLDQLQSVVQLIQTRSEKAASNGKDITDVTAAIQQAQQSINVARSAVSEQSQRSYIVDVSLLPQNTSTAAGQNKLMSVLKTQLNAENTQLQGDISALSNGVMKDAKDDVRSAFLTLAEVPDVDAEPKTQ